MPRQGKAGKVFSKCEKGTWQFHSLCNIYPYLKPLRQRGLHNKAHLAEREFKWTHFALSAPGSHTVEVLLLARLAFCVYVRVFVCSPVIRFQCISLRLLDMACKRDDHWLLRRSCKESLSAFFSTWTLIGRNKLIFFWTRRM